MFDSWGDYEESSAGGVVDTIPESGKRHWLPDGLAEMAPGAGLGSVLASIDRAYVPGHEQVILMQAWSRQVAHAQAELFASMTAVADAEAEAAAPEADIFEINHLASSEIRAALSWTRRAADFQLTFAQFLVEDYPRVWTALHQGLIDLPKARVIVNQTCHLDSETARKVAAIALERAHRQTTGQLRARIQKLVIAVDPASAQERYEQRLTERRVVTEATDSDTANLFGLDLPVAETNAAMRRLNRLAKAAKTADDPRSTDQIRADLLLDLLNGRETGHTRDTRGVVDVRVDLTTLAGLDDNPAEIPGWGPVIADIARQVATVQEDAEWRITVADSDNGQVVHNGITRRRPAAGLRRDVEARHEACVFPGCRMPARDSDLDHRRAWSDGGRTDEENLAPLCRHDHLLKHNGWRARMVRPGVFLWTSPLGLTYTVDARPP
jgi:hypothetical protein